MKTSYLNNITVEATRITTPLRRNKIQKITKAKLNHIMKLLAYRDRAFTGKKGYWK